MSSAKREPKSSPTALPPRMPLMFKRLGLMMMLVSFLILARTFYPVVKEEVKYVVRDRALPIVHVGPSPVQDKTRPVMQPVTTDFSIVIPKIGANAPVIPYVDPRNSAVYQRALTKGVAHAKGTPLPGKGGNTFLFAHSAGNFYDANRYNAVFYLLRKLEKGDEIQVFYKGERIRYGVTSSAIIEPNQVQYMQSTGKDMLTLMTCWPPGTTLKRLVVQGEVLHGGE